MKKAWIDYGRKQNYISNTLIQCYHAENILLLTPLAKYDFALLNIHKEFLFRFYLDQGLIIYNIEEFIQYEPGKCFRPFTEKVVKLRSEATVENDEAKGLTAKLFGNAGKTILSL